MGSEGPSAPGRTRGAEWVAASLERNEARSVKRELLEGKDATTPASHHLPSIHYLNGIYHTHTRLDR